MVIAVLQKHIGFSGINARLSQARLNGVAVEMSCIVHGMVCHGFVVSCRMVHLHTMPGDAIERMSHFTIRQRLMERQTFQLCKCCVRGQLVEHPSQRKIESAPLSAGATYHSRWVAAYASFFIITRHFLVETCQSSVHEGAPHRWLAKLIFIVPFTSHVAFALAYSQSHQGPNLCNHTSNQRLIEHLFYVNIIAFQRSCGLYCESKSLVYFSLDHTQISRTIPE